MIEDDMRQMASPSPVVPRLLPRCFSTRRSVQNSLLVLPGDPGTLIGHPDGDPIPFTIAFHRQSSTLWLKRIPFSSKLRKTLTS